MTAQSYENKAISADAGQAFDEMNRMLHEYRDTNDAQGADVLLEEKLARLDRALDEQKARVDRLALKAERPALGPLETASARLPYAQVQHKAAFDLYVRSGETGGLKALEAKALSAGSGPDGGFLVPPPIEREILKRMTQV